MLADKTETLELYISILGLDKRYERKLYSLGLSELHEELVGSREQFRWEEDRARNWIETERERERRRDGFVAFLPFYRPFWAPLPKRGEGSDNEDPFDDFGFESFLDRFLEAMFRMSWLAIG